MNSGFRAIAAAGGVALVALASAGPASADNSNSNTNNNDVTNIGEGSNAAASSGENTAWPPTNLDWPPSDIMKADSGNSSSAAPPIVMPFGQPAQPRADTPSTTETTKPIVPVDTP